MSIDETGYAVPWHCFIDAQGYIRPQPSATITPDGGGTRCISVIKLDADTLLGSFDRGVTQESFGDIRHLFKPAPSPVG